MTLIVESRSKLKEHNLELTAKAIIQFLDHNKIGRDTDAHRAQWQRYFDYFLDLLSSRDGFHHNTRFARFASLNGVRSLSDFQLTTCNYYISELENQSSNLDQSYFARAELALLTLIELYTSDTLEEDRKMSLWAQAGIDIQSAYAIGEKQALIAAIVVDINLEKKILTVIEKGHGSRRTVSFDDMLFRKNFESSLTYLATANVLPISAHFIDSSINQAGVLTPAAMIIEPDYLVSVTEVAGCFIDSGQFALAHIVPKFKLSQVRVPLLKGFVANHFLDRLMFEPNVTYPDLMKEIRKHLALPLSIINEESSQEFSRQTKEIYEHLHADIPKFHKRLSSKHVFIEPTFLSPNFGLQGRLDMLGLDEKRAFATTVELKATRPYKPNAFGLSISHYLQVLLYDLLLRSSFGEDVNIDNAIYYAGAYENRLKPSGVNRALQYQALAVRNAIVAMTLASTSKPPSEKHTLEFVHQKRFEGVRGFLQQDVVFVQELFERLDELRKRYFRAFVRLLEMENYVAKVGGQERNRGGIANMWNLTSREKLQLFELIERLELVHVSNTETNGFIRLKRNPEDKSTAVFRTGDITVLYPFDRKRAISGQLIKGSVVAMDNESITVRLRNEYFSVGAIKSIKYWNIEPDYLESGLRNSYQSISIFLQTHFDKQAIWLGTKKPMISENRLVYKDLSYLTHAQNQILSNIINAQDYYLLWGPPGTGKTSVMIRSVVEVLLSKSKENILLTAYTNRAVDELCDMLIQLKQVIPTLHFIRIGSRFSVAPKFLPYLMDEQLSSCESNHAVKEKINSTRIFIGTIQSLNGKTDIFQAKHFDRLIVDEASQIIEPALIGLLCRVSRTLLVGDHKQLPAVVVSPQSRLKVDDSMLNSIGIHNLGMSLFERLYRRCLDKSWNHVIGILGHQGRMHEDIMDFVSQHFYGGQLALLDHVDRVRERQTRPMKSFLPNKLVFRNQVIDKRFLFITNEMKPSPEQSLLKTNQSEAKIIIDYVRSIDVSMQDRKEVFTVGIICPFKAQIALVKNSILEEMEVWPKWLSIDTVERYQGSARDIIIIGTCASNLFTLKSIVSVDQDGHDRKLNVALSRAREQVVIIGVEEVLATNKLYADLMKHGAMPTC